MLPAAVVVKDASYFKVFKLESADNAAVTGAIFEHTDTYKRQLSPSMLCFFTFQNFP